MQKSESRYLHIHLNVHIHLCTFCMCVLMSKLTHHPVCLVYVMMMMMVMLSAIIFLTLHSNMPTLVGLNLFTTFLQRVC